MMSRYWENVWVDEIADKISSRNRIAYLFAQEEIEACRNPLILQLIELNNAKKDAL